MGVVYMGLKVVEVFGFSFGFSCTYVCNDPYKQKWVSSTADFVRELDRNHMITVGLEGFFEASNIATPAVLRSQPYHSLTSSGSVAISRGNATAAAAAAAGSSPAAIISLGLGSKVESLFSIGGGGGGGGGALWGPVRRGLLQPLRPHHIPLRSSFGSCSSCSAVMTTSPAVAASAAAAGARRCFDVDGFALANRGRGLIGPAMQGLPRRPPYRVRRMSTQLAAVWHKYGTAIYVVTELATVVVFWRVMRSVTNTFIAFNDRMAEYGVMHVLGPLGAACNHHLSVRHDCALAWLGTQRHVVQALRAAVCCCTRVATTAAVIAPGEAEAVSEPPVQLPPVPPPVPPLLGPLWSSLKGHPNPSPHPTSECIRWVRQLTTSIQPNLADQRRINLVPGSFYAKKENDPRVVTAALLAAATLLAPHRNRCSAREWWQMVSEGVLAAAGCSKDLQIRAAAAAEPEGPLMGAGSSSGGGGHGGSRTAASLCRAIGAAAALAAAAAETIPTVKSAAAEALLGGRGCSTGRYDRADDRFGRLYQRRLAAIRMLQSELLDGPRRLPGGSGGETWALLSQSESAAVALSPQPGELGGGVGSSRDFVVDRQIVDGGGSEGDVCGQRASPGVNGMMAAAAASTWRSNLIPPPPTRAPVGGWLGASQPAVALRLARLMRRITALVQSQSLQRPKNEDLALGGIRSHTRRFAVPPPSRALCGSAAAGASAGAASLALLPAEVVSEQDTLTACLPELLYARIRPIVVQRHAQVSGYTKSELGPCRACGRKMPLPWLLMRCRHPFIGVVLREALPALLACIDDPAPGVAQYGVAALHAVAAECLAADLQWQRELLLEAARQLVVGCHEQLWSLVCPAAVAVVRRIESKNPRSAGYHGLAADLLTEMERQAHVARHMLVVLMRTAPTHVKAEEEMSKASVQVVKTTEGLAGDGSLQPVNVAGAWSRMASDGYATRGLEKLELSPEMEMAQTCQSEKMIMRDTQKGFMTRLAGFKTHKKCNARSSACRSIPGLRLSMTVCQSQVPWRSL
ncbi:hypothetical protein VOLCADRAFT_88877 [Volvox carteri f. nagariensis]|uniref:Uncharacterized protein n=1 Tax=Volvox carteri f. nagariensis TaxID=3068 RepID=D8TQ69_VOLCA|nr:uncharacterized protein VOLCADRAFT_88877 [Volvox carteri f. nagariensis]EFJ50352.1 hypothetical protein VOLCADRAFT_88877 [Volvox carteri f. nagariensis]|eukprot:XP_002948477.1 hypothetical protein VOLCADRAFT_88877 [Volvox carteri f. nagariensis]